MNLKPALEPLNAIIFLRMANEGDQSGSLDKNSAPPPPPALNLASAHDQDTVFWAGGEILSMQLWFTLNIDFNQGT